MLHCYMEGERVGVDGSKIVDVDRRPDRCPRRHSGATGSKGERAPLLLIPWPPPRWEESSPSGLWPPWWWRGGSPSEIGSPSPFSSVLRSPDVALHGFLNSRRFVIPIAPELLHGFFHKLYFLHQKKGPNRPSRRAQDTWAC